MSYWNRSSTTSNTLAFKSLEYSGLIEKYGEKNELGAPYRKYYTY
jgi:hypothetical protein